MIWPNGRPRGQQVEVYNLLKEGVEGVFETGEHVMGERVEARIVSSVGIQIIGAENVAKWIVCGVKVLGTLNKPIIAR